MYEITDWMRYEVNKKGREASEGDELRSGPLRFIKLKVHGHSQSNGYRKMLTIAKAKSMEVFGVFCKLLEIAGDSGISGKFRRGVLLVERDGEPATVEDLAFLLGVPNAVVKNALKVLCDKRLGWVEETSSRKCRESPEMPEPFINSKSKSSQPNTIQLKSTEPGFEKNISPTSLDLNLHLPTTHQTLYLRIEEILGNIKGTSETTTFKNLSEYLMGQGVGVVGKALNQARKTMRNGAKDKKAYFVGICTKEFGFKKTADWSTR